MGDWMAEAGTSMETGFLDSSDRRTGGVAIYFGQKMARLGWVGDDNEGDAVRLQSVTEPR